MTLLDQDVKKQEPKGKKIILFLLIFLIILLILAIVMMAALGGKKTKNLTLSVDDSDIAIEDGLLITDENGISYISIQMISKSIGYDYLTGEYKKYSEDATNSKAYLQNENQIIQFEINTNKIYKTEPKSDLDYEEYTLNHNIINVNNLLYISLDDVNIGLGIKYEYLQNDNKIVLKTADKLTEEYKSNISAQTDNQLVDISKEYNNEKALSYNMLVVSNENQKWGVVDSNFSTIIGNRYSSLEFIESVGVFIASDENKYGVISKEPNKRPIIDLNYEEINIINNSPVFYQVKLAGKYGIMNGQGKAIVNNEYDSMGYISQSTTEQNVLIIDEFGKNKETLLVVCKENKYGLINLSDGKAVGNCILDKIYAKTENGEKKYYVQLQEKEFTLDSYIESVNTTTVNIG